MNIKQLEVFVSIAETGSFSKGADAASITQSTASQHIAALESVAGVRLLDRTGRGAVLTEAGRTMLSHAQKVISSLRTAEMAMRQFSTATDVELKVSGSSIPGTYLIPGVVAILRNSSPGITVRSEIRDSLDALALLKDETVELALVGTRADAPFFETENAGSDLLQLVTRHDHVWARTRSIGIEDLKSEYLVFRESGSGTGKFVTDSLHMAGIQVDDLKKSAIFSSSEAVKQAVLAGCGAAFISEMAVAGELARGELVAVNLSGIRMERTFTLVWRRGRTLSPAAEAFRNVLRGTL